MPLLIMQRICWNTRGWQIPSGSTNENGFPAEHGFGYEEWNFQFSDNWNGFIFPYTYSIPSQIKLNENNGMFDIGFFARHGEYNQWVFIGIHRNVQLIEEHEYPNIINHFDVNGVFERRAKELLSVAKKPETYQKTIKRIKKTFEDSYKKIKTPDAFRIKSSIANIELFPQPILIEKPNNHRFTSFTYVDQFPANPIVQYRQQVPAALAEDGYYRESMERLQLIIPRHNQLSNYFCVWLRNKNIQPIQEENCIDILFGHNGENYIAELKIVYGVGTTKSIREALGQLLEYNYYPSRNNNQQWMIILDQQPTLSDLNYIDVLIAQLNLPLRIGWQTDGDFQFHPVWQI